jgi:hypothetical protein
MTDILLALYHWWQVLWCTLPLPWTFEVREAAYQYETERIESVTEEVTEHVLSERLIPRSWHFSNDPVGFAVVGWRLSEYTQYADVARMYGGQPKPDIGIDWAHERFDVGVGDPCWPNEGRIHVRLHIECGRWTERMMECPRTGPNANCADCCDGECCWYWVDPVEMCYRSCWIAGSERIDDQCGPR